MKFYAARTLYPEADEPTTRYFSTEEKAKSWINQQDNGLWWETYDENVSNVPFECCSWDDIKYWNGMI